MGLCMHWLGPLFVMKHTSNHYIKWYGKNSVKGELYAVLRLVILSMMATEVYLFNNENQL